MASPAETPPTREQCVAALNLVLDNSFTQTEAAARVGVSYMVFRRRSVRSFFIGREQRIWLADLEGVT
jgi:hypothetical protein